MNESKRKTKAEESTPGGRRERTLVVLHSVSRPSRSDADYITQLQRGAAAATQNRYFSWRAALFGSYDVLHMHWPEFLIRNRNPFKALAQKLLFPALMVRAYVQKIPIVRTLHNISPHEQGGWFEKLLLTKLDELTTLFVAINDETPFPEGAKTVVIRHAAFVEAYEGFQRSASLPHGLLYFGHIRPYKNVLSLISAFRDMGDTPGNQDAVLTVAGAVRDPLLHASIVHAAAGLDSIQLYLDFVPDEQLVTFVTCARLIVLPYEEMHNSGSIFVPLSLGRPVLVPASPVNEALSQEVGRGWIHQFHPPLTGKVLGDVLHSAGALIDSEMPNLSGRTWRRQGEAYYSAYATASALGGHPRRAV